MKFGIGYVPPGSAGSTMVRNGAHGSPNKEAAFRQTPKQHSDMLNKFKRAGMSPAQLMLAQRQGEQLERLNPRYWNDQVPRRDLRPQSSWIDEVEYLPDLGLGVMKTKGREYYYPMTAVQAAHWMLAPSVGRWYNQKFKLKKGEGI